MTHGRQRRSETVEATATERAFHDLELRIAEEIGVPVDAYRGYLEVCSAVDRYVGKHRHPAAGTEAARRQQQLDGDGPSALGREAATVVEAALDLYGWPEAQITSRPDHVTEQAQRILIAGLAVKAGLSRMPLVRASELERTPEGGIGLER